MMLPDEEKGGLRFVGLQPQYEDLADVVLPFDGGSAAATAYKERRVVQLVRAQFRSHDSLRMAARLGSRTTLAVPLIARGQSLGVVVVLDRDQSRSFTQAQMDRAVAVAGQLSLALLSARLYEDLRDSYAKLERTQKELIDRERLAALGELSASIAHEVRNPLGVIFNSVGSLRRLLQPRGDVSMLLDIVGEEADRLNRMVGDLLDYSRPVRPSLEPVPLRPLLEEAVSSAQQQIGAAGAQVRVRIRVDASAATVRADARLLRQALINLFLNALQAMPRGGVLEVRAAAQRGTAEVIIDDSGPGIPEEIRGRIFQPFFTTKATGTGLGLAVVKRIVEGHGGSIEARAAQSGAEFCVRLPLDAGTG
jgi:signal transduction histidine kinase